MKKIVSPTGAIALLLVALVSVALLSSGSAIAQAPFDLEGSSWRLISYLDETGKTADVIPDTDVTVEFRDGKVSGSTGCNTYNAPYEASNGRLSVGLTATTMRMCAMPIMDQEAAFIQDIQAAATYTITGDRLTIMDAQGVTLLVFQPEQTAQPAQPVSPVQPQPTTQPEPPNVLAGGTWLMTAYNDNRGSMQAALADVRVAAIFGEDGRITGSAGCNTYTAPYTINGDKIEIGPAAATRKMCSAPIMNQEIAYLEALRAATSFTIEGGQLTVSDAQGAALLIFQAETPGTLTGPIWRMTGYNDGQGGVQSALADVRVTATFGADAKVGGSAGCNTYNAAYQVDGDKLTVGMAISTLMACEPAIMEQEGAFLSALQAAASYKIKGDQLTISDAQGATLLTFQADKPGALTDGVWLMTAYNNGRGGFQSALEDVEVTAIFDATEVSGSAGCNTYSAPYMVDGNTIQIGSARATRMMCEEPIMEQEDAYLNALTLAATFTVEGDRLMLRTADDASAVSFVRQGEAPAETAEPMPAEPEFVIELEAEEVYVTIVPAVDAPTRSVALTLTPDGTAELIQDFGDDIVLSETGTWTAGNVDILVITLTEQNGEALETPQALTFLREDGYMTLVDYEVGIWGEAGLKLNLAEDIARRARPALVTLNLAADSPLDPTFVSVNGGGEVDAGLLDPSCVGYIHRQPVTTLNWAGEADLLRIFFYSDGDPTLVVLTPSGELLCNDNVHAQLLDPFIEIEEPVAGEYRIWVGSAAKHQLIPGVLVLTTNPEVDLGTFALGRLIQRPSIPQTLPEPVTTEFPPLPESADSVKTRFGDFTRCIAEGIHQANCFLSDGAWGAPGLAAMQMEPPIEVWGACEPADGEQMFSMSATGPTQTYRCSKTLAGWFVK